MGRRGAVRIVLVADVHGNSLALDAVADEAVLGDADEVVFLGDAVANGYDPRGALDRLRRLDARLVMGNTDADMLDTPGFYRERQRFDPETQRVLEISLWCRQQLTDEDRDVIGRFQPTVALALPGDRRLVCFHGSQRSATDVITAETPETEMEHMLGEGSLFAGGHTHVPLLRRVGTRIFINPGSIGLPFARYGRAGHVDLLPAAQYAVVDATEETVDFTFHAVPVDVAAIRARAHQSGMPHADWWASRWDPR